MANLKEKLLGLINDGTVATMGLFDTVNETLNSIDWNSQFNSLMEMKDSLMEKSNELLKDFNELMKQVKNNLTDFEVIVPFDESLGEKLETSIEDGKLTVEVSFEDENTTRSNKTTVKIPENCDVEKMSQKYNAVAKTMTIVIPKVIVEPTEKTEEEKPKGYRLKAATTKKNEESHEATSKLLKKFHENTRGKVTMPRAANGRFVRRKPNAE